MVVLHALKIQMPFPGLQSLTSPSPSKTSPSALFLLPHWAPATYVPLLKHAKVVPIVRPLNPAWISLPQNLIELVIQAGVLCAGGKSLLNRPAMLFSRRAASLRLPPFPPWSQEEQEDLEGTCQWYLPVFSEKQKLPQDTPFTTHHPRPAPPPFITILARTLYVAPS